MTNHPKVFVAIQLFNSVPLYCGKRTPAESPRMRTWAIFFYQLLFFEGHFTERTIDRPNGGRGAKTPNQKSKMDVVCLSEPSRIALTPLKVTNTMNYTLMQFKVICKSGVGKTASPPVRDNLNVFVEFVL